MADVNINKFRASVVRDGSKPASPGFIVSEGQSPTDPAGSGQNHLPVTIATAATGLAITDSQVLGGAGTVGQYIRGDGSLADFPQASGGGSSVSYYLNGSISQGTIGGVAYKELNKVPILGAGTDFTINADGYIASFLTDAGDPNLLEIPGGNWNFETYFSASSSGGTPTFYVELYKYDGTTFTLIASSSSSPELIAFGTNLNPYFSTLAVPTTTLALTDRLAVRYYVNHSGRTITLHTENNHLCQVVTTFTTGLTSLNGLTAQVQNLAVGTSGTDFNIASATATHTFNLPTASATNRGALSSADWTTFNNKQNALTNPVTGTGTSGQVAYFTGTSAISSESNLFWDATNDRLGIGGLTTSYKLQITNSSSLGITISTVGSDSANPHIQMLNGAIDTTIAATSSGLELTAYSAHALLLKSSNVERFRIFALGNVHIGPTPASDNGARLQVSGTANFSGSIQAATESNIVGTSVNARMLVTASSVANTVVGFNNSGSTTTGVTNNTAYLGVLQDFPLVFTTNSVERFRLAASTGAATFSSSVTATQLNATTTAAGYAAILTNTNGASDSNGLLVRAGSTSSEYVVRFAPQSDASTFFTVKGSGNVGIGTTSPTAALHISSSGFGATGRVFQWSGATTGTQYFDAANTGANLVWGMEGSTGGILYIGASPYSAVFGNENNYPVQFGTNNAIRMTIASGGNVLIGTTTDNGARLQVAATSAIVTVTSTTGTSFNGIELKNSGGSFYVGQDSSTGGFYGSGTAYSGSLYVSGAHPLVMFTSGTERMRITSVGRTLLLGSTSSGWENSSRALLELNNTGSSLLGLRISGNERAYFYHNNNHLYIEQMLAGGSIYVISVSAGVYLTAGATSWTANSDERLKNINGNIENAVDKLMTLRTINYSWKNDLNQKENLGLIAQDVEKVFPQVIDINKLPSKPNQEQEDETEYLGVRYQELIPVLVKAIQELKQEINNLKN